MSARQYPIRPAPDDDARFTFGLAVDVAKVLEEHGYPKVENGLDFVELQQALFGFLYGKAKGGARDELKQRVADAVEYGIRISDGDVLMDGDPSDRHDQEQRLDRYRDRWPDAVLVQRSVFHGAWTGVK